MFLMHISPRPRVREALDEIAAITLRRAISAASRYLTDQTGRQRRPVPPMRVVWQHRRNEPIEMPETFDPNKAARYIAQAHESRATFCNLPRDIAPRTVAEAYAAQAALAQLLAEREGPVAGLKIATTTKVMQQLMGIDHPCGGLIFERRVFRSPAQVAMSDHMHVVLECELAVRIG